MYYIKKKIVISAAHKLRLNYESKCQELHGHNWIVTAHCKRDKLDVNGMVIDFGEIKKRVIDLDHCVINEKVDFNPTAENLARFIWELVPRCFQVDVEESPDNMVSYTEFGEDRHAESNGQV